MISLINQISVKVANTNEVVSFENVEFDSVNSVTEFVKEYLMPLCISKPYVYGNEVVYKVEYSSGKIASFVINRRKQGIV